MNYTYLQGVMMLKNGTLVMLVQGDGYMPPLGSVGEVIGYDDGDYEVLFHRHPCPVPPGIFWYAEPSWLVPLDGGLLSKDDLERVDQPLGLLYCLEE